MNLKAFYIKTLGEKLLIINNRLKNMFTWILILLVAFIVLSTITYMNIIYKIEEVYIASKFIPEGTKIDRSNFTDYIGILKVPSEFFEKMKLLKASQENQLLIMKNYIKYNRDIGDFITHNTLKTNINDPMKYLISEISSKVADNKFLIPISIDIPINDRIFTQGVQVKDRVQIWFIKSENQINKKVTKLVVRYKDVPIVNINKSGDYISSIVIVLPSDLAKKYELEKRYVQEVKVVFNPLNYLKMKEKELDVVSSEQIEREYKEGKIYDLKKEIQIESFSN